MRPRPGCKANRGDNVSDDVSTVEKGKAMNPMKFAILNSKFTVPVFDPITGMRTVPFDPFVCFAKSDDDDDGEADDDKEKANEKKHSDADVEKLVRRRLAKAGKEKDKEISALKKQNEELSSKVEALAEKLDSDKDAETKANNKIERELNKANKRIEELTEQLAEAQNTGKTANEKLRGHIKSSAIRKALSKNGVLTKAMGHATDLMMKDLQAEILEEEVDGEMQQVVVVKVNGKETDDISGAAEAWLKENPHFAQHPGAGTGEKPPGRKSTSEGLSFEMTPENIEKADAGHLIEAGFAEAFKQQS